MHHRPSRRRSLPRVARIALPALAAWLSFAGLRAPFNAEAAPPSTDRPELAEGLDNKPERLEWFRDLGFGMFIHWSLDSQIGSVISHSLAGASPDYRKRFFEDLPRTFNPRKFRPEDWAVLARLAGMKYVVFTTKHHSGFAMWDTKTTPFSVMHTPVKRDLTADIVKAFRAQGITVGFYFSPEDFHWLHQNGKPVTRRPHPGVLPRENPALMKLDRAQLKELATRYGPVDVWFLDGPGGGMRDVIWRAQPRAVITRDVIDTPEQTIPGVPLDRAWESCLTMGTQWHYKPTHETYKSGTELIEILIETRAKGGNLLLNVGPKPDGELPIEQEQRLREVALWNFAFGESIDRVRPWVVTNEGNLWFTRRRGENTVYVFITKTPWVMGDRKRFTLRSVKATARTTVSVLGSDSKILEYKPEADAASHFTQDAAGLHLDVIMAQRLYNDRKWPNPLVVKLTDVEPALRPPVVSKGNARREGGGEAQLAAKLESLGQAESVEVGFEYRRQKQTEELLNADAPWRTTPLARRQGPGDFSARVKGLGRERYEFRAVVKHPLLTVRGEEAVIPD
jgi:alpha-L-fucosidase